MIDPGLKEQIDVLLAQADQTVAGGILAWLGNTRFPRGVGRIPTLTQLAWESAYGRLQQGAVRAGVVRPLAEVREATKSFRPLGELPIALAHYDVAVPQPAFVKAVRAAAAEGRPLPSPPASLAAVIRPTTVFMATTLMHAQWNRGVPAFRGRDVTFVLPPAFQLTGPGVPAPDAIEIDAGDGLGFRPITIGGGVSARYTNGGAPTLTLRARYGRRTRTTHFGFERIDGPVPPEPDEVWQLQAPADSSGAGNTGRALVYLAHGSDAVHHPFIIAEGFPGGHPVDFLYEMLNQADTLEMLRERGWDVIIVGFDRGFDFMQRNAGVIVQCIEEARRRTTAPAVVGGVSMGGLIARYALAWMEHHGREHGACIFLTIDTPHTGSYTNLAAQWLAHEFRSVSPELGVLSSLLNTPANRQFVRQIVRNGRVEESAERQRFLRDLEALGGYPERPLRLAIACGRGDGKRSFDPHLRTLRWSGAPFASVELWSLPEGDSSRVIAEGESFLTHPAGPARLEARSAVSWEAAPGGQNIYNAIAAAVTGGVGCGAVEHALDVTCSVPTVSALGFDPDVLSPFVPVPPPAPGGSPFNDYYCLEDNRQHVTITPGARDWLLRSVGAVAAPPGGIQPMSDDFHPATFDPHATGFLADPYPVYARFRQHAPVYPVKPYNSKWVFRAEDVATVLGGKDLYLKNTPLETKRIDLFGMLEHLPKGIFSSDPPRHELVRGTLEPIFMQGLQHAPVIAGGIAKKLLADANAAGERLELMTAYALPLPSSTLFSLLGFPKEDWTGLVGWITTIANGHDITQPLLTQFMAGTAVMALHTYLQAFLEDAGKGNAPGIIPTMARTIRSGPSNNGLRMEDVQASCINFTVAGYVSVMMLIGSGTVRLLKHPDQLKKLRANPDLMTSAVEEMIRFDAPAQLADRVVADDTSLGGFPLRKGETVTVVLGSACRDEKAFRDPDTFDIRRNEQHHGFGGGIHTCIGAPLVRMIAPVAFQALLDEMPRLALDGDVQWQTDPFLRGPVSVPLAR